MASLLETIASPPGKTTPAMCMIKEGKTTGKNPSNTICVQDERRENTWVKNLLSTPLSQDQIKALAHSPNFAIVPQKATNRGIHSSY